MSGTHDLLLAISTVYVPLLWSQQLKSWLLQLVFPFPFLVTEYLLRGDHYMVEVPPTLPTLPLFLGLPDHLQVTSLSRSKGSFQRRSIFQSPSPL